VASVAERHEAAVVITGQRAEQVEIAGDAVPSASEDGDVAIEGLR